MLWSCSLRVASLLALLTTILAAKSVEKLPSAWFWGDVQGQSYLTRLQTERAPQYCRSSWAASVAGALSDRLKILRPEIRPAVALSTQVLLNCAASDGCSGGGDPLKALQHIKAEGIPDETCQTYKAKEDTCDELGICRDCTHGDESAGQDYFADTHCWARHDYSLYGLKDFGIIEADEAATMVERMQKEIRSGGTITCSLRPSEAFGNYQEGILDHAPAVSNHTQYVNIVGWDASTDVKYWIARNCWGEVWGIGGYFKIRMGVDALGIEEKCYWGTPTVTSPPANDLDPAIEERGGYTIRRSLKTSSCDCLPIEDFERPTVYRLSKPKIENDDIPEAYDIRNVEGRNYATVDKNQHIPSYCGSCSYFSSMSALSDRLALKYGTTPPLFDIAPQAVMDCVGGGCHGAWPVYIYRYLKRYDAPHENCAPYRAVDQSCTDINHCRSCSQSDLCSVVPSSDRWGFGVEDYGSVVGRDMIKAEIARSGPVVCIIASTHEFRQYAGGIFNDTVADSHPNHAIMVGGWGTTEDGVDYWIVRNRFVPRPVTDLDVVFSWGRYWGEDGWARIAMGPGEMLLSSFGCNWATPRSFDRPMPYKTLLRSKLQS